MCSRGRKKSEYKQRNEISIELLYLHLKWFKIRNGLCFVFYALQEEKKNQPNTQKTRPATGHPCCLCLCDREISRNKID